MCDTPEIQDQWKPKVGDKCCATERKHNNDIDEACIVQEVSTYNSLSLLGLNNKLHAAWFYPKKNIWLPRQEDWQNLLFTSHYAPALPIKKKVVDFAVLNMHKEFIDFWESRLGLFEQPVEYWCALYMWIAHKKTWTEEGWR